MPEPARAVESEPAAVLDALASAVLAVPGVVRLEPTLSTSGPGLMIHRNPTDGIRFLTRVGAAEVDVSIATTAACEARGVVHHVRATVADVLITYGHRPGTIAVSVLAVEPVPTASNPRGKSNSNAIAAARPRTSQVGLPQLDLSRKTHT